MNYCFFNFDFERWRTDLFLKLSSELQDRGHHVSYFNYKRNVKGIVKKTNAQIKVINRSNINVEEFVLCDSDYYDFASSYAKGINQTKKNVRRNNLKLKYAIHKFSNEIHALVQANDIEVLIVWGGFRYLERSIIAYARMMNLKIYIFEFGYFRPFTLTIETKGLNFESSLPRSREFYLDFYKNESFVINENAFAQLKMPTSSYLTDLCIPPRQKTKLKQKALTLASIKQFINARHLHKMQKRAKMLDTNERFIFVPFQVETDSQIINFSSKIKTMKNLVALVSEAVERYNEIYTDELKVIFKPHPVAKNISIKYIESQLAMYQYSSIDYSSDTNVLIESAQLVITINSTVGIEALMAQKNVITLGDAFYNIEGLVHHCHNLDNLPSTIHHTLNSKIDTDFTYKYLTYLRNEYFSEIYYEGADEDSVKKLCDRII